MRVLGFLKQLVKKASERLKKRISVLSDRVYEDLFFMAPMKCDNDKFKREMQNAPPKIPRRPEDPPTFRQ